jgi:hypothetical protein
MLGRLRDAVADVRDAGSNATRWLGIDEAAAYMGSGNEKWRIVGARNAVAEEPELECNAAAVECSISGAVRGHAALQALEQFAAARQASHARGEWSSAAAPLADAATARPRRWPLTPAEDQRLDEPAADGVDSALSALAALAADASRHDDETARAYESLRRALSSDAAEANASLREAHALLTNARGAARTAESQLASRRAALVRADEAARKAADDAEDARGATEAAEANARADVPQEVARAAALARDRARTHERRCGERARESARLSGHARGEVAAAADGAIQALDQSERAEAVCSVALHELRSSLAAPRVLGALRAISAAERAASDARRLKLDALDAALDAAEARAEPPRRPPPTRVAKALGLLRDAARRREAGDIHTGAGPALDADVDAALRSLFAEADAGAASPPPVEVAATAEAKRRSSTAAVDDEAPVEPRVSLVEQASQSLDEAVETVGGALEGLLGDAPPAPPLSEPDAVADRVVAYVSQGDRFSFSTERAAPAAGARAAAVIRALNRQRSRQTALPDALWLRALARVCLACLDACARANDVRAPAVLAMLAQTFYVDHDEGARDQRLYLGDLLGQHETWASQQFWERSTASAVLDAVDASRLEGDRHGDLLFSSGAQDAARRVHLCVHAQLAAFCVSMKAFGAPLAEIRRHACQTCARYQLPAEDLRVLLRDYDEPAGEEVIV